MMLRTTSSGLATQVLRKGHTRLTRAAQQQQHIISPKLLSTHQHYNFFGGTSSEEDQQHNDHHHHRYGHGDGNSSRNFSTINVPSSFPSLSSSPLSREDDGTGRYRGHVVPVRQNGTTQQRRLYHVTPPSERAVAIILGLATVSAVAYAGSSAVSSYNEWKASLPSEEELEAIRIKEEKDRADQEAQRQQQETEQQQQDQKKATDGPRENFFRQWFDVGSKYYEGGFEDTMTKREAALILGVRESSSPQRIKDAHRKLLILNHPDTGGSTYLSGKINEAKDLLLKGRQRV